MKIFKIITSVLVLAFVAIQFFSTAYNQSEIVPKTDFILVNKPSEGIGAFLQTSCYDCHSNNTEYPWYNKIQPVAWFLEDHIKEGKKVLNFNDWDALSDRRKKSKLKSIISQIKDEEMPLASYTLIHRNAGFSESEKEDIITHMNSLKDSLE